MWRTVKGQGLVRFERPVDKGRARADDGANGG